MRSGSSFLERLRQKWQVKSILQVVLILLVFSIGGSLCGYIGRKVLMPFDFGSKAVWLLVYVLLVTILWPFCVLLISIPFGQFHFLKAYLTKMGNRIIRKHK